METGTGTITDLTWICALYELGQKAANGANPIPIIVPCHRVVGSKGELTGFGGGLDTKRWLLEHEGALMELGA